MNKQISRTTSIITGVAGVSIMATFVIGLAKSIADGFAGFDGALPFIVIVAFVLSLAIYNFYEQCIRDTKKGE
ncbi:MAG: hypothetical protein HKN42_10625 [Granulosicoccus sp.]|nr:hypothetical protein [Granulosicoccus sp.]